MNILGSKCKYRPAFSVNEKEATVVKVETVISGCLKQSTVITLDDGSLVDPESCYFSLSDIASDRDRIASATSLIELATS